MSFYINKKDLLPNYDNFPSLQHSVDVLTQYNWNDLIIIIKQNEYILTAFDNIIKFGILEFSRFLLIKIYKKDYNASIISPTSVIDIFWHYLLLFPKKYYKLCQNLNNSEEFSEENSFDNFIIDHNPFGGFNNNEREGRLRTTFNTYQELFNEDPLNRSIFWNDEINLKNELIIDLLLDETNKIENEIIQNNNSLLDSTRQNSWPLTIESQDFEPVTLYVDDNITIEEIKENLDTIFSHDEYGLIFHERHIYDHSTLSSLFIGPQTECHIKAIKKRIDSKPMYFEYQCLSLLYIHPDDKIDDIITMICSRRGYALNAIELKYNDEILDRFTKISDYNINDEIPDIQIELLDSGPTLTLFVKSLTGKTTVIDIYRYDTIFELKEKVHLKEGIPIDQQRLVYCGKELNDEVTFNGYAISSDSTIHLILKLRGC